MTDDEILDAVLEREGRYVDHPADHGGPTAWGITLETLAAWRGHPVTAADMHQLTRGEAVAIYRQRYLHDPGFAAVRDDALRALLVDWAVHSGPIAAVRGLQRALGVRVDGILGPQTLTALVASDGSRLYRRVLGQRLRFVGRLLLDPTQAVFAEGWCNRLAEFVEAV